MKYCFYIFLPILVAAILHGCQGQVMADKVPDDQLLSRGELYRSFRKHNHLKIIYPTGQATYIARYRQMAETLAARYRKWEMEVEVLADREAEVHEADSAAFFLLGTPAANQVLASLEKALPIAINHKQIKLHQQSYTHPKDVVSLSLYPHPQYSYKPLFVLSGITDEAICDFFQQGWRPMQWGSWPYELYRDRRRIVMGSFDHETWAFDPAQHFDLSRSDMQWHQSPHIRYANVQSALSPPALAAFMQACEDRREQVENFAGKITDTAKITIYLYPSAELKGLMLLQTDRSHIDERGELHLVMGEEYREEYGAPEVSVWLRQRLGKPAYAVLERGLALRFAPRWRKRGHAHWAARLHASGNAMPLSELLDDERLQGASDLVVQAMAGDWVDFLIKKYGKSEFMNRYHTWSLAPVEIKALDREWKARPRPNTVLPARRSLPAKYCFRGFNFTHEGYNIHNGYLSARAADALGDLAKLGVNAVAIVPYSYIRDPRNPSPIPLLKNQPGTENDESVIFSLHHAKRRGMFTLLKPQIWLGGGSWPGDIAMEYEADWQAFF